MQREAGGRGDSWEGGDAEGDQARGAEGDQARGTEGQWGTRGTDRESGKQLPC